jgi:hypothetical protein
VHLIVWDSTLQLLLCNLSQSIGFRNHFANLCFNSARNFKVLHLRRIWKALFDFKLERRLTPALEETTDGKHRASGYCGTVIGLDSDAARKLQTIS